MRSQCTWKSAGEASFSPPSVPEHLSPGHRSAVSCHFLQSVSVHGRGRCGRARCHVCPSVCASAKTAASPLPKAAKCPTVRTPRQPCTQQRRTRTRGGFHAYAHTRGVNSRQDGWSKGIYIYSSYRHCQTASRRGQNPAFSPAAYERRLPTGRQLPSSDGPPGDRLREARKPACRPIHSSARSLTTLFFTECIHAWHGHRADKSRRPSLPVWHLRPSGSGRQ